MTTEFASVALERLEPPLSPADGLKHFGIEVFVVFVPGMRPRLRIRRWFNWPVWSSSLAFSPLASGWHSHGCSRFASNRQFGSTVLTEPTVRRMITRAFPPLLAVVWAQT